MATPMSQKLATKNMPFRVYMGYDSHEDITFEVAKYSMLKYASVPVEVIPLKRNELQARGVYTRTQDPKQSTEFTYCRFFVPYLQNYKGWAMFVDDDFLWTKDIAELLDMVDDTKAIMCVQHDYKPTVTEKLAGRAQSAYPRKNWSSMVLWNCGHPANEGVSLDMINAEGGAFLYVSIHRSTACFLLSWSKLVLQCCLFNIRLECVICTNMIPVECFKAPLLVDQGRLAHRRDPLRLELPRRVVPGHGEGGQAATRRHSLHGGWAVVPGLPDHRLCGALVRTHEGVRSHAAQGKVAVPVRAVQL
jgi:hypothetical protein